MVVQPAILTYTTMVEIFQCRESIQDIITYSTLPDFNAISHVGRLGCPELIPDIEQFLLVAIFKMATTILQNFNIARNFSITGINSGHYYLPTYQILMISDNVEFLRYCGGHFENIEKFLPVAIFKMATTIPHKFNIARFQRHFTCG
jgi:hypothetical protein